MSAPAHRLALAAAGAFTAATLTWILWGVITPGDFFAGGSGAVWLSLAIAAVAGGYAAFRWQPRRARIALWTAAVVCLLFWVAVPDGWWAKAPPPMPGAAP